MPASLQLAGYVTLPTALGTLLLVLALYMALELQSLPLYVLAAFNRDSLRATESGRFFGQVITPDYVLLMTATPRDADAARKPEDQARVDAQQVVGLHARGRIGLHHHALHAPGVGEVVEVGRAQRGAQRLDARSGVAAGDMNLVTRRAEGSDLLRRVVAKVLVEGEASEEGALALEGELFLVIHLMVLGRLRWLMPGASLAILGIACAWAYERLA